MSIEYVIKGGIPAIKLSIFRATKSSDGKDCDAIAVIVERLIDGAYLASTGFDFELANCMPGIVMTGTSFDGLLRRNGSVVGEFCIYKNSNKYYVRLVLDAQILSKKLSNSDFKILKQLFIGGGK